MIIDKTKEIEEAPPAYEAATTSAGESANFNDHKISPSLPLTPVSPPISPSSPSFSTKGKGKAPIVSSWWSFGSSQTAREIRTTVLGIVRDLVKVKSGNAVAAQSILESCAEACSGYSLSLSSLLQEKSIESHTPLYWAIINRPPDKSDEAMNGTSDLLTTLLSYTAPLSSAILTEVRQACLITDDQLLFQRLRLSPEFASLSGTDEMLLGEQMIPDDVTVENLLGDEGAFAINFRIPHFQKRMRVSSEVGVEFIARGRLWRLALCVADRRRSKHGGPSPGAWCIVLSLMENSSPTWIDSRLIIPDVSSNVSAQEMDLISNESFAPPSMFSGILGDRSKKAITIRIQSKFELCSPQNRPNHNRYTEILVQLDSVPMASSIQHVGSSYIGADESLAGRLEARLKRPQGDAECIIC
ncbi:hypothetical protein J3R30DRAFT_3483472 [Lentinula aciculospora]|uniref:Uncharacterized protein n=1 Tax=Lentinula aciculospora TaxID=153920 RepID=A0A9W9A9X5_9AGAR|nr:hypothetical protein J3R30DRAFT_3483472 [Lentinula aciculospora]